MDKRELVQDGKRNYLKLLLKDNYKYAENIFSYEEIPGFLPLEIRRINGVKEAYYDITGKIPLLKYLKEKRVTKKDVISIILQLLDTQDLLDEYLLDGNDFLINAEYLFWNKNLAMPEGIYCAGSGGGKVFNYGRLVEDIMDDMDEKNKELVYFIYGLHKQTKEKDCVREELRQYIKGETVVDNGSKEQIPDIFPAEKPDLPGDKMSIRKLSNSKLLNNKQPDKKEKKGMNGKNGWTGSVCSLLCGVGIVLFLWKMGLFTQPLSGEMDIARLCAASAFFMVISGYVSWRLYRANKKNGGRGIVTDKEKELLLQICFIPEKSGEPLIPIKENPFYIGAEFSGADAVLESGGEAESGFMNYVKKDAMYLKLVCEEGHVYAIDQESDYGTSHNGKCMVPWQKKELKDGDYISIGSHDFVVEISSSGYVM